MADDQTVLALYKYK